MGTQRLQVLPVLLCGLLVAAATGSIGTATAASGPGGGPRFTGPAAFDVSEPLRDLAASAQPQPPAQDEEEGLRPDRGPPVADRGNPLDTVAQAKVGTAAIPAPTASFEGLSNHANFDLYGFRPNPPDPNGEVGPNHYVELVNVALGVYTKTGALLLGPVAIGTVWDGFAVDECTEPSGDPVVLYDQFADRWILSQFTTRGIDYPREPLNLFYNCVAVSTSGDPTGSYFRYAFTTGYNFPDYPKYGVWRDSYLITTREFGIQDPSVYGVGVYGLERTKMINGNPAARAVSFLLQAGPVPINLIGDGLLPADLDGGTRPSPGTPAPIIGTQDDGGPYGAAFDAVNVWELDVRWRSTPTASIALETQVPVAGFDSIFPCAPSGSRDCLPQPGINNPNQYLDVLSYRQRPLWRLAYRTFATYASIVTNQSVEARPGVAGVRWYELRNTNGAYSVRQQGTFAPADGVHRWMGSVAMDKLGDIGLGYSVVNGTTVFPGIRYTGRLAADPPGSMTLGEGVVVDGSGVQTSFNSRWGDYTSMTVDPVDDCTFWYVNEYYTAAGQASSSSGWQTRIASFRLPGC